MSGGWMIFIARSISFQPIPSRASCFRWSWSAWDDPQPMPTARSASRSFRASPHSLQPWWWRWFTLFTAISRSFLS